MQMLEQSGCVVSTSRAHPRSNTHGSDQILPRLGGSSTAYTKSQHVGALALEGDGPWSCSGVLVDQRFGIVFCHGSIFIPFLLADKDLNCLEQCKHLLPDDFFEDLVVEIQCPAKNNNREPVQSKVCIDVHGSIPELGIVPLSNQVVPKSITTQHCGQLLMMVPCREFQNTFLKLFNEVDGWRFSSEEEQQGHDELKKDLAYLHWFAVLKIKDPVRTGDGKLQFLPASSLQKGEMLFACGSPFGGFFPDIFLNTLSKGVVSNLAGERNAVILTDARCLPGTEGGGVFTMSEGQLVLVGLIVVPLCWKAGEWVGLTIVCSLGHILANIERALSMLGNPLNYVWPRMLLPPKQSVESDVSSMLMPHLALAAVLVDCGQMWGSGVLVNARTALTCRHVVSAASMINVRRKQQTTDEFCSIRGKVVFATKETSPFDFAVVELEKAFPGFVEPVLGTKYFTGEDVSIISFGAFGKRCGPSVTSGILSAVIKVDDAPVMLQTTCAVHGGSSGGPVFATHTGELLGIVASNTKDSSVGATYPHLNFSVPITVVQPGLLQYTKDRDLKGFEVLQQASETVRAAWRLQKKPKPILGSKL